MAFRYGQLVTVQVTREYARAMRSVGHTLPAGTLPAAYAFLSGRPGLPHSFVYLSGANCLLVEVPDSLIEARR